MAHAPRPPSGQRAEHTPSIVPTKIATQDHAQPKSSPSGLGALELVELTSSTVTEGVLGPNKDGRVRNPVPSKLKGKTDNKQGNFGVMHIGASPGKKNDAHGKDAAAERDAMARKTSEATASRAKAAQSDKYVPPKKRGLEAALIDGQPTASRGSPFAVSRDDHRQRARPSAPDETKSEQARLLTLLRSINPVTVVDQICKAVAYFGGIPGAPPPEDGIFPESVNTRETGAMFIGWLAEIFPDLSPRSPEIAKDQASGSRKKKGKTSSALIGLSGDLADHEPPTSQNGYGYGPAVSAPAWGLPPSLALVNPQASEVPIPQPETRPVVVQPVQHIHNQHSPEQASTPVVQQRRAGEGSSSAASASKRGRGRPKGSRNKGKGDGQHAAENNTNTALKNNENEPIRITPQTTTGQVVVSESVRQSTAPSSASALEVATQQALQKSNEPLQYAETSWQGAQSTDVLTQGPASTIGNELSPEERAVLEAFRNTATEAINGGASPIVDTKIVPGVGQKRKRAPAKPKNTAPNAPSYLAEPTSKSTPTTTPRDQAQISTSKDGAQWTSVEPSSTPVPPPKRPRQRKPKVPVSSDVAARSQTVAVVGNDTPPIAPSTIPDSMATSSQQSVPVSRPPAEGLEAHYERFASIQQQQQQKQQQNGRSSTPTVPPQHARQHSKPSSITSQQSTPQMQQQQMQQSKPQQQSIQRDDMQINQAPLQRPTSASFYTQRSQPSTATSSYNQQYPPHQPSPLYSGHQASPQLSTSSYRTSSSNPMAQASPQFPQAENAYRTSSPHTTIPQPSSSFVQNDTSYRTSTAPNLAQPSPSFPQTDNTYRAPSTHSMAQSTPSYSTSRSHAHTQSSQQGSYGGFSDSSYIDLPTLESLGHSTSTGNTAVSLNATTYGQSLGVGLGAPSRSSTGSGALYGSSGLGNQYDSSTNDLLRGVSRSGSSSNALYGTSAAALNTYDTSPNEHEMRERLMRGLGGRR